MIKIKVFSFTKYFSLSSRDRTKLDYPSPRNSLLQNDAEYNLYHCYAQRRRGKLISRRQGSGNAMSTTRMLWLTPVTRHAHGTSSRTELDWTQVRSSLFEFSQPYLRYTGYGTQSAACPPPCG